MANGGATLQQNEGFVVKNSLKREQKTNRPKGKTAKSNGLFHAMQWILWPSTTVLFGDLANRRLTFHQPD